MTTPESGTHIVGWFQHGMPTGGASTVYMQQEQPTPAELAELVTYDGRVSAECEGSCADGACLAPQSSDGCGGCCDCLGGCRLGYEQQIEEASK